MAEKPTTLLERLNQVLESLSLKMGGVSSGTPSFPTTKTPEATPGDRSVLGGLKSLFDNFLSRLGTDLKEGAKGSGSPRGFPPAANTPNAPRGAVPPIPFMDKYNKSAPLDVIPVEQRVPREKKTGGKQDLAGALGNAAGMFAGSGKTGEAVGAKLNEAAGTAQMATRAAAGDPTALIQYVEKDLEKKYAALGKANDSLTQSATSDSAGRQVGGVFGAGEAAGDMMGGATGEAVSKVAAFGKKVSESVDRLRDMDRAVLQMNFRFGEVSSSMAMVQARQEVRDIMQDRQKGEARAGSQERLAEAMSELNQSLMPFENAFMNFSTNVLTGVTRIVNWLVQNEPLLKLMTTYLEKIAGKGDEAVGGSSFNADIFEAGAEEAKKFGRPPRIPPGP